MRTKILLAGTLMVFGAAGMLACITTVHPHGDRPPVVRAPIGPEDEPFYHDLAPYGEWVHVSGPGWVWSPYDVPAGWQPYRAGHWVLTDYGWTWASEEHYGWVVYHHGRWHVDDRYGWVWVPGTDWGPAWVAWHEGGDWVGWAPLPWQVTWRAGVGLDWGGLDIRVALAPSAWCFVPSRHIVDPRLTAYIAPAGRNGTLIRNTVHVTNYTIINNHVVNHSIRPEKIGRAVGHTIRRYPVAAAGPDDAPRGGRVQNGKFVVRRPRGAAGDAPPARFAAESDPAPQPPRAHPVRGGRSRPGSHGPASTVPPEPPAHGRQNAAPEEAPEQPPSRHQRADDAPAPRAGTPTTPPARRGPRPSVTGEPKADQPKSGQPQGASSQGEAKQAPPGRSKSRDAADSPSKSGKSKPGKPRSGAEDCGEENGKDCADSKKD